MNDPRVPCLRPWGQAFVADNATITGEVSLGAEVSVWYGTVIRGDVCSIEVGPRTNIQDLCLIHPMTGRPVAIGSDVTVGHGAIIHCDRVGERSLIGMGARLLTGARIGSDCIVAAGALVPERTSIPEGSVVMGMPARVVRSTSRKERAWMLSQVEKYIQLAQSHLPGAAPFDWRQEEGREED